MIVEELQCAIVFADISGSSILYQRLGDRRAKILIYDALKFMGEMVQNHQGSIVKTIGDEIMARFNSAEDACLAAIQIQESSTIQGITYRIGINFGQVILDENDVFGDTVNAAAYVASIAQAEQILITDQVTKQLPAYISSSCEQFDRVTLKGSSKRSTLYRLRSETTTQEFGATRVHTLNATNQLQKLPLLQLQHKNKNYYVFTDGTSFKLGRDINQVQLPVKQGEASRNHCHIRHYRGKFVLTDHSTNGTYVQANNLGEIYLRRESLPLVGKGVLSLGRPGADNEQCIHFICP